MGEGSLQAAPNPLNGWIYTSLIFSYVSYKICARSSSEVMPRNWRLQPAWQA
ncbi:hypothetical protein CALCODRAFT_492011 [Calocera cornea HHB12733]|uniref:Uncharacterized protein n=1 Tax=Calocera cornea HHB12733 TaxID=1353952 RepID=A0A165IM17_9BASI|nr:hypothetical protein CALCODRAFT_492011 [Calocera cornea HHB12733]